MTLAKPIAFDPAEYLDDLAIVVSRASVNEHGCWLWTGAIHSTGYGVAHRRGEVFKAHRFAYELLVGPIDADLHLDHLCRNRPCVNPKHLEPVTCAENIRRSPIHYGSRTHCAKGHPLTPENVRERKGKGEGGRRCIECRRDYMREYMRERRSKART